LGLVAGQSHSFNFNRDISIGGIGGGNLDPLDPMVQRRPYEGFAREE
jgi:hypothetical protein